MLYFIDDVLISFYRVFDTPVAGYLFGTFCLALICVVAGRATYGLLQRWNHPWIQRHRQEMIRMHNLSLKALSFKDKAAFRFCNKEANDAFGKYFFTQMAMGISTLWPVPFALAWMDMRFSRVAFSIPGLDYSVGYLASFIPVYILAKIIVAGMSKSIPVFQTGHEETSGPDEKMMTLADLAPQTADRKTLTRKTP